MTPEKEPEELDTFLSSLTDKELFAIAQEAMIYNDEPMQNKCRAEMIKRKPHGVAK